MIKVFILYILLRTLLRAFLIDKSYDDTSIFIFRVWVFGGYKLFDITKYLSHLEPDCYEVHVPLDPEQPSAHYRRLATYFHVCLSLRRGVKPLFSDGYMNIYPMPIRLRRISMSSQVTQFFAVQKMASLRIVGSVVSWTAECILVAITPALYDFPY